VVLVPPIHAVPGAIRDIVMALAAVFMVPWEATTNGHETTL